MNIVSVSRRTDIAAFYSRWFLGRLDAGYCHTLNPYGGQVYRVSLRAEDCLALVFWTRNASPLFPHLRSLEEAGYHYYFLYTINGYGPPLELHNPSLDSALRNFRKLSEHIGPDRTRWRYDPIILSERTSAAWHREHFRRLCQALEGATNTCTFSFVDFYAKAKRNLTRLEREQGLAVEAPPASEQLRLAEELADIAADFGITLRSCCDDSLLGGAIQKSHCVDLKLVQRLHSNPELSVKAGPTRPDCGCVRSIDIGVYDSCLFGCNYCYATNSPQAARRRWGGHVPQDSILWRPKTLRGVDLEERVVTKKTAP